MNNKMKLNYLVISTKPLIVKFFYEDGKKYGEFYIRFNKETSNIKNPKDSIGIRGIAEIEKKSREYAKDLSQAFADAMSDEELEVSELPIPRLEDGYCEECGEKLEDPVIEPREDGYSEIVIYCKHCGATYI
jgi:hypothetical protein